MEWITIEQIVQNKENKNIHQHNLKAFGNLAGIYIKDKAYVQYQ